MRSGVGSDGGSSLERRIFNQLLASRKRPGVSLLDHVGELVREKQAAVRLVWIFAAAEMNVFSSTDRAGVKVVGTGIVVDPDF